MYLREDSILLKITTDESRDWEFPTPTHLMRDKQRVDFT